jgi:hypothetical protein
MAIQPDAGFIINELSNQIATLAREIAILKSIIAQYENSENEKVATPSK